MFQKLRRLFTTKPATPKSPAPAPSPTGVIDLGNGFTFETRDEFSYRVALVEIPLGGFVSFRCNGREVFRIDANGGRNV